MVHVERAMSRWIRHLAAAGAAATAGLMLAASAAGQRPRSAGDAPPDPRRAAEDWGGVARDYDGRFTFVRLRWQDGAGGGFRGMSSAWNHDFPRAEQNLMAMLDWFTLIDANTDGSLILRLDDPQIFKYPLVYMWEPGFWSLTDAEAARFREYLLKGGFAIFDDFEYEQWDNFAAQMRRVLPDARFVKLDATHPIFDTFFRMTTIDFPHPLVGVSPTYYGVFEDNDPAGRLMLIANHNNDVAEYWEWSGTGLFPVDMSSEAWKLGINYMIYALTR
jgi:hypothetical protein